MKVKHISQLLTFTAINCFREAFFLHAAQQPYLFFIMYHCEMNDSCHMKVEFIRYSTAGQMTSQRPHDVRLFFPTTNSLPLTAHCSLMDYKRSVFPEMVLKPHKLPRPDSPLHFLCEIWLNTEAARMPGRHSLTVTPAGIVVNTNVSLWL